MSVLTAGATRREAGLSARRSNVRIMNGKALFASVRDGQPGLRERPGGPLTVAQPSRVDDVRAARFDAYRARLGSPPRTLTMRRPGCEPGAWRTLNDAAAAYRERAVAARAGEADPAAAEIARRGRAAIREALRHHRTRVVQP
jgi:hypothetical protein